MAYKISNDLRVAEIVQSYFLSNPILRTPMANFIPRLINVLDPLNLFKSPNLGHNRLTEILRGAPVVEFMA
jgi:hypothetical protein